MGELADIARAKSPYFIVEPGETVVATYKGFKLIPSTWDPNQEQFQFVMELADGTKKFWNTGSNKIALALDSLEGKKVAVKKTQVGMRGDKPKYSYEITEVVDNEGKVSKKQADEIEKEMAG